MLPHPRPKQWAIKEIRNVFPKMWKGTHHYLWLRQLVALYGLLCVPYFLGFTTKPEKIIFNKALFIFFDSLSFTSLIENKHVIFVTNLYMHITLVTSKVSFGLAEIFI